MSEATHIVSRCNFHNIEAPEALGSVNARQDEMRLHKVETNKTAENALQLTRGEPARLRRAGCNKVSCRPHNRTSHSLAGAKAGSRTSISKLWTTSDKQPIQATIMNLK